MEKYERNWKGETWKSVGKRNLMKKYTRRVEEEYSLSVTLSGTFLPVLN